MKNNQKNEGEFVVLPKIGIVTKKCFDKYEKWSYCVVTKKK